MGPFAIGLAKARSRARERRVPRSFGRLPCSPFVREGRPGRRGHTAGELWMNRGPSLTSQRTAHIVESPMGNLLMVSKVSIQYISGSGFHGAGLVVGRGARSRSPIRANDGCGIRGSELASEGGIIYLRPPASTSTRFETKLEVLDVERHRDGLWLEIPQEIRAATHDLKHVERVSKAMSKLRYCTTSRGAFCRHLHSSANFHLMVNLTAWRISEG